MDLSGLIDRFWLWRKIEPYLLIVVALLLLVAVIAGWWVGWACGNHMIGAGVAGCLCWVIGVWWGRTELRHMRPR
jgi:hypothetical protein